MSNAEDDAKREDDAKKFLALPPYNWPSNIVADDGYFYNACERKWGKLKWEQALRTVQANADRGGCR